MFNYYKKTKYKNKKTVYNGNKYDSKKEAKYAYQLNLRLRAKDIKKWQRQVRMPIYINNKKICVYILDFKITHNDNSIEFVDVKGFETDVFKLKKKMFEAYYPQYRLSIIKHL